MMPLRLLCLAFIITPSLAAAQMHLQDDKDVFVYTNTSFAVGSPAGVKLSLATLFLGHHELSAGYNYYTKKARATPSDYLKNQGWDFGFAPDYPQDEWSGLTLTYGYVLYPNKLAKVRYVLRAGVMLGKLTTPDRFTPVYSGFNLFGPANPDPTPGHYDYTSTSRPATALLLQPTMDISLGQAFAFSVGVYGIFGSGMNGGGVSAGMLLGKVSHVRRATHRNTQ